MCAAGGADVELQQKTKRHLEDIEGAVLVALDRFSKKVCPQQVM